MIIKHIKPFVFSFLKSEYVLLFIGYVRWFYFVKILNRLKTLKESDYAVSHGLVHNLDVFNRFPLTDFTMKRMTWLINAVCAIEFLNDKSSFLIIGPRTESDLLKLKGRFYSNDIVGIDLITYSPLILLQDMHNIEFENNSFNCVVCGWTLTYSKNHSKAIEEIIRVTKNNGIIAIGFEHSDNELKDFLNKELNKTNGVIDRIYEEPAINSIKDIEEILTDLEVKYSMIFNYDGLLKGISHEKKLTMTGLRSSQVMAIFQINK